MVYLFQYIYLLFKAKGFGTLGLWDFGTLDSVDVTIFPTSHIVYTNHNIRFFCFYIKIAISLFKFIIFIIILK